MQTGEQIGFVGLGTMGEPMALNLRRAGHRLCCPNRLRDSLFETSVIAGCHEQLVTYEVQDQELAFVQHGSEAARFAIDLV